MKSTISLLMFILLTTIFCDTTKNLRNLDATTDAVNYSKDLQACTVATLYQKASPSVCTSVNSKLIATGTLENQCCYVEYTQDWGRVYRLIYGEEYGNYSTGYEPLYTKMCININTDETARNGMLYGYALLTTTKQVNYDCENGISTFKASDYKPTTTQGKILKEVADCSVNLEKDKCFSGSENFETDVQCCWFSLIVDGEDDGDYTLSSCIGLQKVSIEYFSGVESEMTILKNQAGQVGVKYAFTCTDKNGKKVIGKYEYKTGGGSLDIEKNEQSSSNFIGLTTFSILLIALLL